MFAPTLPALIGFGPLLPGSGGRSLESTGGSCDREEEEVEWDLELQSKVTYFYDILLKVLSHSKPQCSYTYMYIYIYVHVCLFNLRLLARELRDGVIEQ